MKNIYCYIAKSGYAARVKDTRSYDAVRFVYSFSYPLPHVAWILVLTVFYR